ncbi:hypothetical protein E4U16_007241 [Claviceps sp. LM84 group G4]|nr:hypothetical protein E4U16_007241 [Claviceps sp. LM84 group G4]
MLLAPGLRAMSKSATCISRRTARELSAPLQGLKAIGDFRAHYLRVPVEAFVLGPGIARSSDTGRQPLRRDIKGGIADWRL